MNSSEIIDYSVIHHSALLNDTTRICLFKNAVQETVSSNDCVVDIGSGTGLLAAYAASFTTNTVYAIEYYEFAEKLAKAMLTESPYKNIDYLKKNSFDVTLEKNPDILITETIGQIGPEENIVEICYDFHAKHPSIKKIIPCQLALYAELITSEEGSTFIDNIIKGYLNASFTGFDYSIIQETIHNQLAHIIFQNQIHDAKSLSKPMLLTNYHLGETTSSTFSKVITLPKTVRSGLIHLYFVANLTNNITLSSRFDQTTHWQHSFIPIAKNKKEFIVSYLAGSGHIQIQWQ